MISQISEGLLEESSPKNLRFGSHKKSYPELEAILQRNSAFGQEIDSHFFPGAHSLLRSYFGKGLLNPLTIPQTPAQAYKRFHLVQRNLLGSNWSLESSIDSEAKEYIENGIPAIYVVTHSNIAADFMSVSTILREQNSDYTAFPVVGENLKQDASFEQFCNAGNVIYVARKGVDTKMIDNMNSVLSENEFGVYIASTPGVSNTGRIEFDRRIGFLLGNFCAKGTPIIPVSISYSEFPASEFSVKKNLAVYSHGEYMKDKNEDKERIIKGLFPQSVNPLNPFSVKHFISNKPSLHVSFSKPIEKLSSKRSFIAQVNSALVDGLHLHDTQKHALSTLVYANSVGALTKESTDYLSSMHGMSLDGLRAHCFNLGYTPKQTEGDFSLSTVSHLAVLATPAYQKWTSINL